MSRSKILERAVFGDPFLRREARQLTVKQIKSVKIQQLIKDMRYTLEKKKYGIGLAAPQVSQSVALTIIGIKATPTRPKLKAYRAVVINPKILKKSGKKRGMWEGCISMGSGGSPIFAKAMRYPKIRIQYTDELGLTHEEDMIGLKAHLLQHEIDHLQGILFVDRVVDTTTYMNLSEYKKRIIKKKAKHGTKPIK